MVKAGTNNTLSTKLEWEKLKDEMFIDVLERMWHILRVLEGCPRRAEFIIRGAYIHTQEPRMP